MTLHAWRIVKAIYAADAFSGEGARRTGGRWNSSGKGLVYTAGNVSLATLEMLVHLDSSSSLPAYVLIKVEFDEACVEHLDPKSLPPEWRSYPFPESTQVIGDKWIEEARSLVLEVPSAVEPRERVFLINPAHPDFKALTIHPPEPIVFDERLV